MADVVVEAAASNTAATIVIRREDFANQFRITFVDEFGTSCDWRFQVGEPVYYSSGTGVYGCTFISCISAAGWFSVQMCPTFKNEVLYTQKYPTLRS